MYVENTLFKSIVLYLNVDWINFLSYYSNMELVKSKENSEALQYLNGGSAHSDTVNALFPVCDNLNGVEMHYVSKSLPFSACYFTKNREIFALVKGMQFVTLRLSVASAEELIEKGGAINNFFTTSNWIDISPFQEGINLGEWANKAYSNYRILS